MNFPNRPADLFPSVHNELEGAFRSAYSRGVAVKMTSRYGDKDETPTKPEGLRRATRQQMREMAQFQEHGPEELVDRGSTYEGRPTRPSSAELEDDKDVYFMLGQLMNEVHNLRSDIETGQRESLQANRKASTQASTKTATIFGALVVIGQAAYPYLVELWKVILQ